MNSKIYILFSCCSAFCVAESNGTTNVIHNSSSVSPALNLDQLWLEEIAKESGTYQLPSGVLFQVQSKGQGQLSPLSDSFIELRYTAFRTSGEELVQETKVYNVPDLSPEWQQIVLLMREQDEWILYLPQSIGTPAKFAQDEPLKLDLRLMDVGVGKPAAEASKLLLEEIGKSYDSLLTIAEASAGLPTGEPTAEPLSDEAILSREWLKQIAASPLVYALPGGVLFEVLERSTNPNARSPTAIDHVKVSYTARLRTGAIFESYESYSTRPEWVTRGLGETLQLMREGDRWLIYIPAELAYGSRGTASVPPDTAVSYLVQMREVQGLGKPANAATQRLLELTGLNYEDLGPTEEPIEETSMPTAEPSTTPPNPPTETVSEQDLKTVLDKIASQLKQNNSIQNKLAASEDLHKLSASLCISSGPTLLKRDVFALGTTKSDHYLSSVDFGDLGKVTSSVQGTRKCISAVAMWGFNSSFSDSDQSVTPAFNLPLLSVQINAGQLPARLGQITVEYRNVAGGNVSMYKWQRGKGWAAVPISIHDKNAGVVRIELPYTEATEFYMSGFVSSSSKETEDSDYDLPILATAGSLMTLLVISLIFAVLKDKRQDQDQSIKVSEESKRTSCRYSFFEFYRYSFIFMRSPHNPASTCDRILHTLTFLFLVMVVAIFFTRARQESAVGERSVPLLGVVGGAIVAVVASTYAAAIRPLLFSQRRDFITMSAAIIGSIASAAGMISGYYAYGALCALGAGLAFGFIAALLKIKDWSSEPVSAAGFNMLRAVAYIITGLVYLGSIAVAVIAGAFQRSPLDVRTDNHFAYVFVGALLIDVIVLDPVKSLIFYFAVAMANGKQRHTDNNTADASNDCDDADFMDIVNMVAAEREQPNENTSDLLTVQYDFNDVSAAPGGKRSQPRVPPKGSARTSNVPEELLPEDSFSPEQLPRPHSNSNGQVAAEDNLKEQSLNHYNTDGGEDIVLNHHIAAATVETQANTKKLKLRKMNRQSSSIMRSTSHMINSQEMECKNLVNESNVAEESSSNTHDCDIRAKIDDDMHQDPPQPLTAAVSTQQRSSSADRLSDSALNRNSNDSVFGRVNDSEQQTRADQGVGNNSYNLYQDNYFPQQAAPSIHHLAHFVQQHTNDTSESSEMQNKIGDDDV